MKSIFILFFLIYASQLSAQILRVKDAETALPLEMVAVFNKNKDVFTATNNRGAADISIFNKTDSIFFSYIGYKNVVYSFSELDKIGFVVLLETNPITLSSVVISATRWGQTKRDVPGKITRIPSKNVSLLNPQTAADLLATSGEVFIQKSQQGGGSPMIRGFSTNRLLYTIDGVRMNTAIYRSGNIHNVISLDPFAIENTEIFFGPGGIIYGSDAIGGVMGFRTLTPLLSVEDELFVGGKAVTRYASANNEITTHFDINLGWQKWASVSSISTSSFSDLKMGRHGPDEYLRPFYVQQVDGVDKVFVNDNPLLQNPTAYSQFNIMQKIRFMPNENWDFQYAFHYSETSDFPRYDRLTETTSNGLPRSAVWNYGPQKWMMNYLGISHNASSLFYDNMFVRLAWQNFEESRIDRRYNHHRLRTQLEQVDAYSINIDFLKSWNKQSFFYGLEGVHNDVVSNAYAENIFTKDNIPVSSRYPNAIWQSFAAYLNYKYRFSEKVLLQAGGRFTKYIVNADFSQNLNFYPFNFSSVSVDNNAVNGSLGLVYSPNDKWTVSISAASGFRAPNIDDMGKMFDFQAGDVIVPNSTLSAEYAYNGELNVAKIVSDVLKIDISTYYTHLEDAMVRRPYQINGQDSMLYNGEMSKIFAIQNAAVAYVMGAHFGFEFMLPGGLSLASRYNYQVGEEEMEDGSKSASRHVAPSFGNISLSYNAKKLTMQFYLIYNSKISYENLNEEERQKSVIYAKDINGNPYSPSWHTLNFKLMYPVSKNFLLSAGLENITDQRYRTYSSGIAAAGRNFVMSLKASF